MVESHSVTLGVDVTERRISAVGSGWAGLCSESLAPEIFLISVCNETIWRLLFTINLNTTKSAG